jgi:RNA-directed DNA polymerase
MPRPIWRGHLRLALVSCPVALYNARHDLAGIRFNLINLETGNRIRMIGGKVGVSFSPAASDKALRQTVRGWSLHERSDKTVDDLVRMFNVHIRGWINYYGRFYPSALYPTLRHIDVFLARWADRKFKSLRRHKTRAIHWLQRLARRQTELFAHWALLFGRGRTMGAV